MGAYFSLLDTCLSVWVGVCAGGGGGSDHTTTTPPPHRTRRQAAPHERNLTPPPHHHHTARGLDRQRHTKELFERDTLSAKSDILAKLNMETQRVERQIVEMEKMLTDRVGRCLLYTRKSTWTCCQPANRIHISATTQQIAPDLSTIHIHDPPRHNTTAPTLVVNLPIT